MLGNEHCTSELLIQILLQIVSKWKEDLLFLSPWRRALRENGRNDFLNHRE